MMMPGGMIVGVMSRCVVTLCVIALGRTQRIGIT
jgi:hypothetical protein